MRSKEYPKSSKNLLNLIKKASKMRSGAVLGAFLIQSRIQEGCGEKLTALLGFILEVKSIKNRSKNQSYFLNPTWSQLGAILVQLMGHLAPTWPNLELTWSQLGPTWLQNPRCAEGRGGQKSIKNAIRFLSNPQNLPRSPQT